MCEQCQRLELEMPDWEFNPIESWVGVDLDATLAYYDGWICRFHIGEPIMKMVEFIKSLQASKIKVKIFTARVSLRAPELVIKNIQNWTEKHGLGRLEVTNVKDIGCLVILDDRAISVEPNTGRLLVDNLHLVKGFGE